jgi:DNA polymerase-4
MPRVIFHLDMDAFYASVEQRDSPELRGKPVIVGAEPERRGVVCAASYEARAFGVRSAMPSRTAHRLCPDGIFVRPRMSAYRDESRVIMAQLAGFGGAIEQVSVDEAYLDMSHQFEGLQADDAIVAALDIARDMKRRIFEERHLTASIGLATNKLLAKIASDHRKPNGLFGVLESEKVAFLRPLSVRAIHGVGNVTGEMLASAGINTIGDIQKFKGDLRSIVGSFASTLSRFAHGEDDRALEYDGDVKSISAEETFERDTSDRRVLVPALRQQAEEIAARLLRERLAARTIQIKVRYSDFRTLTRQTSVEDPVETAGAIYGLACSILRREQLVHRPLRLLGLGVSGLVPPSMQLQLRI